MSARKIAKHAQRAANHPVNKPGTYLQALMPLYEGLSVAGDARCEDQRVWRLLGYAFEDALAPLVRKGLRVSA